MAAFVRETEAGWEVVEGDRVLSAHASHIEALDAALARNGGRSKDALLRDPDTKDLNGAWRWLHATDVEDAPAYDGARIDETTVAQAVASLNSQPLPRPINGGAPDSPAHSPSGDSIATGYAHHAVTVVDSDGRHGAYVIAELVPSVARVVDSGRVAWTSIGLGGSVGDDATIRDAEFDHLALTNTPAVKTLTSSAAIRKPGERFVAVRTHRVTRAAGPSRNTMPIKTSVRSEIVAPVALRGPALDALTKLCATLGVDLDAEMSAEEWDSPARQALCAVRMIAKAEKVVEGLNGTAATEATEAVRSVRRAITKRAEVSDEDMAAMAKAVGLEAGASMADMIAAAGKMKPAEEPKVEADKPADEATRSEKAIEARIAQLEAQSAKVAMRAHVETEFAKAKAVLPADVGTLVDDLLATRSEALRGRLLTLSVKTAIGAPPATRSVPATGSVDVETDTNAPDVIAKRARDLLPQVRKDHPGEPEHLLVARAQKLAAKSG